MDKLRKQVSIAQQGSLPILPPQAIGFKCGDLLTLDEGFEHPLKTPFHSGWFAPTGENLSDVLLSKDTFTPPPYASTGMSEINCGSITAAELSIGFKSKVKGLFSAGAGGNKGTNTEGELIIKSPSYASAIQELKGILHNRETKSRLFHEVNWGNWFGLEADVGVLAVVDRSWTGDLQFVYNDGKKRSLFGSAEVPLPASAPATLNARASASAESGSNLGATGEAAVGFSVYWLKAAYVDKQLFTSTPRRVVRRADHDRLLEAASWLKLTDLTFRDDRFENAMKGMQGCATYIAQQTADNVATWGEVVTDGLSSMSLTVAGTQTQQGCFTVTSTDASTDYAQARSNLVSHIASGNYGDDGGVTITRRKSFNQSVNFIISYSDEILSKVFDAMKSSGGSLDIGNGWFLTGMRLAVEFEMYKSGLLPVYLNSGVVDKSQAPTMVFRALGKGAFLLTPVEGVPDDGGESLNRTFGNGGCPGWKMVPSVQFLDPKDADFDKKMLELERDQYTAVLRSKSDIDYGHKLEQVKMVRYVLDPPHTPARAAPAARREAVVIEDAAAQKKAPAAREEAIVLEAATGPVVAASQEVDAVAQSPILLQGGPSRLIPGSPPQKKRKLGPQLKSASEENTEVP